MSSNETESPKTLGEAGTLGMGLALAEDEQLADEAHLPALV